MEAILRETQSGILEGQCTICGVLSNREDALGIKRAQALGFPTRIVSSKGHDSTAYGQKLLTALSDWTPDVIVLAGFMRILSRDVIAAYRGRIVNIHPADTAAYQGPDGYGWAASNKLTETSITVHLVDEGVDTGPVLHQEPVSLEGAFTREDIAERGLQVEHALYSRCLAQLFAGHYDAVITSFQLQRGRE
ncbi:MAG: phosphoribosylglycinamide formyltransferase [Candidatus Atribacteria bacterium]|nr:MAG: phosphoribosylglycinamide formyltransferase [Candidatus Atribacteria bacterium]